MEKLMDLLKHLEIGKEKLMEKQKQKDFGKD